MHRTGIWKSKLCKEIIWWHIKNTALLVILLLSDIFYLWFVYGEVKHFKSSPLGLAVVISHWLKYRPFHYTPKQITSLYGKNIVLSSKLSRKNTGRTYYWSFLSKLNVRKVFKMHKSKLDFKGQKFTNPQFCTNTYNLNLNNK